MSHEPSLQEIAAMVVGRYGCHAVLLYGSRARGDHDETSDHDLLGLRDAGEATHAVFIWRGAAIDVFVEADAAVAGEPAAELMRLRGAKVLHDEHGGGAALLGRVEAAYARGRPREGAEDRATLGAWVAKMLTRVGDADPVLAGFRRAELLVQLPEIYFSLRGRWWPGPKEGLAWLRDHDPAVHDAYAAALRPGAQSAALEQFARLVLATPEHGAGGAAGPDSAGRRARPT